MNVVIGVYNLASYITLGGLLCALFACLLALHGNPHYAVAALIWAGIFDLFDGMVARRSTMSDRERSFGIQIDSLVDIVSFGLTPVLITYGFGATGFLLLVASAFFVCAAAQRLAYFNVTRQNSNTMLTHYTGLPVTYVSLIVALMYTVERFLSPQIFSYYSAFLLFIVGGLFIYPLRIPKPKGIIYVIMPLLAVLFTFYWTLRGISLR